MDDETSDKPIPQLLRVVYVMDVTHGHADVAETGAPIAIVTLGHRGEVEQGILLFLREARKLAGSLMAVLANFGDEAAEEFMEKYRDRLGTTGEAVPAGGGVGENNGSFSPQPNPEQPPEPPSPSIQPTGLTLSVKFRDRKLAPMVLEILGGFRCKKEIMVLFRCNRFGEVPFESVLKIVDRNRNLVQFKKRGENEILPKQQWATFCAMAPEGSLRIGQRLLIKMTFDEIKALVKRKFFRIAPAESINDAAEQRAGKSPSTTPVSWNEDSDRIRRDRRRRRR